MNLLATVAPQWHRNREVAREATRMMTVAKISPQTAPVKRGGIFSREFWAAANPGINRPMASQLNYPDDYRQAAERIVMIRYGQQMEDDIPYIESILADFETYVVGDLRYCPNTGNPEADKVIRDHLEWRFSECDNAHELDLTGCVKLAMRQKKRCGEWGAVYVETEDTVKLAMVEADCIGNPLLAGSQDPLDFNGIMVDANGAPVEFKLWRRLPKLNAYVFDRSVRVNNFIHFYDKYRVSQKHGITAFKNGITRAIDLEQTIQFAIQNIKFRSSQLPAIQNEQGRPKAPGSGYVRQNPSANGTPRPFELEVNGVTQQYLQLSEGYVEYPHDFPNANFRDITDDLKGDVALGVHLPPEFCFRSEAGGVLQRFYIEKAQRTFDEEKRMAKRVIINPYKNRVLRKDVDAGWLNLDRFPGLADSMELFRGDWHMGRSVSTDYGNDTDSDIKLIDNGLMSYEEHAADNARDLSEIRQSKKRRTIEAIEDANEIAAETGRTFEEVFPMIQKLWPNPPANTGSQNAATAAADAQTKTTADAAEMTARFTAKMDELRPASAADVAQEVLRQMPAPQPVQPNIVNITNTPPAVTVQMGALTVEPAAVNVHHTSHMAAAEPANVTVNVPAAPIPEPILPPNITVNVPMQPPPVVNVTVPPLQATLKLDRGGDGKLSGGKIT